MIKEALLIEINKVRDPHVLHQLYDYLRLISNSAEVTPKGRPEGVATLCRHSYRGGCYGDSKCSYRQL